MITYKNITVGRHVQVFLDKKYVGDIKCIAGLFIYYPRGDDKGGDAFRTLADCKASLK